MSSAEASLLSCLINATWQAALVGALGSIALRSLRGATAKTKHRVAAGHLLVCAAVPLIVTPVIAAWRDAPASVVAAGAPVADANAGWRAAFWITRLYACGVFVRIVLLARSAITMSRLRAGCAPITSGPWHDALRECRAAWPVADVMLCSSSHTTVPIVCGWRRATIVIPAAVSTPPRCELARAVLGHELAHVSRRDVGLNFALQLLTAPLFFHPAVAWMKRATSWYRELACDELAIGRLALSRHEYARALLQIASRDVRARQSPAVLSAGSGGSLEMRVAAILGDVRTRPPRRVTLLVYAVVLIAAVAVAPRYAVTVEVEDHQALSGEWHLDLRRSRPLGSVPFGSAVMTIAIDGPRLSIRQTRMRTGMAGTAEQIDIDGRTDGRPFDVRLPTGQLARTRAWWHGNRLILHSAFTESAQVERGETFVRGGQLVVMSRSGTDRALERAFQFVFRRGGAAAWSAGHIPSRARSN